MKPTLHFGRLVVRRMYDVPQDGLDLTDLGTGVNIIYGPNAAGKTTLARALQASLWPQLDGIGHAEVEGHFTIEGTPWRVDVDGPRVHYQRDGLDAGAPDLPDAEKRDQYHLHLHELLRDAERSSKFAQAILRAAVGGVDVSAARDTLGFKEARPRKTQATTRVEEVRKRLREEKDRQAGLEAERKGLDDLKCQRDEARAARAEVDVLDLALAYHRAARAADEAQQALSAFPKAMAHAQGNEEQVLKEIRRHLDEIQSEHDGAENRIAAAQTAISESILPEGGIPAGLSDTLDEYVRQLKEAEQAVENATRELNGARRRADAAWRQIEGAADEQKAARINAEGIEPLIKLVQGAEDIRARQRAMDAMQHLFGDARMPEDLDRLRDGTRLLQQWLAAERAPLSGAPSRDGKIALGVAIVLVIASVALGWLFSPLCILLLLLALPLLFVYFRPAKREQGQTDQDVHRNNFEELHLDGPAQWDAKAVRDHLFSLYARLAERRVQEARARKWNDVSAEGEEIETRLRAIRTEREEVATRLGLAPDVSEEKLFLFFEHLQRWQQACADVASREAELEAGRARVQKLLGTISTPLVEYGLGRASDAAEAHGKVNTLARAESEREQEQGRLVQARRDLERAGREQAEAGQQIAAIFHRLELEPEDDEALLDLCRQLESYEVARKRCTEANVLLKSDKGRLEAHPRFKTDLLDFGEDELERRKAERQTVADKEDGLSDQISRIEQRIETAEHGHSLEDARAEYEKALRKLAQERESDYQKIVGWRLAEYVREQTREQQLPEVFRRARKLFSTISRGRYKLLLDERHNAFGARDNVQKRGLVLDELSSGTRVQLLLAVRMAFVECQERGCKLPLVLDETLANSDDERAQAIIEAVLEIAGTGRQVFYLTAQRDEVAKWERAADGWSGVALRVVPIADVPASDEVDPNALPTDHMLGALPVPDGLDHAAYGALLGVPAWDARQPVTMLPLWYLIEDPRQLHRLMEAGIRQWGALKGLGEAGAQAAAGLDATTYRRAATLASALHAWRNAWEIGRGKPVNRYVLLQSRAVSDRFINRVDELCIEINGDGRALLRRLREGEVSGFRTGKIDELEMYLTEHGYIAGAELLSEEEAWGRALATVGDAIERREIEVDHLRQFFGRIRTGVPQSIAA